MGWQPTDDWPDGRGEGGAFRAAAEMVVAERSAPTATDTLRLWWHSTPDHPFGAVARRVALTARWLYAETREGGRRRAPLDVVRGSRREAGRVIYAVEDGDDLVVVDRGGDALERALDAAVGATGEWRSRAPGDITDIGCVLVLAIPACFACVGLLVKYGAEAMRELALGMWTSEAALGLYGGLGGLVLLLLFVLLVPESFIADTVGLTTRRGVLGLVGRTRAAERIAIVTVLTRQQRTKRGANDIHCVKVELVNPDEELHVHTRVSRTGSAESEGSRQIALGIGRRLADLYGVELADRGRK